MEMQFISPSVAMVLPQIDQMLDSLTQEALKRGIADYTKQLCESDPELADMILEGKKTLPRCIRYVLEQAQKYVSDSVEAMLETEFKQLGQVKVRGAMATMAGSAVPDSQVYQWAKDYYYGGETVEPKNTTNTSKSDAKGGKTKSNATKSNKKKAESTEKSTDSEGNASSAPISGKTKNPNAMDGGTQISLDGFATGAQGNADSEKSAA